MPKLLLLLSLSATLAAWFWIGPGASTPAPAPTLPPADSPRVIAEGRLLAYPGYEVLVSSELTAQLLKLAVREKDAVRRGELIAELKADDYRAEGERVKALIGEEDAQIRYYERQVARAESLLGRHAGSEEALDAQRWKLETAKARRASLLADAERLMAILAKTRILAPIDGVVVARHADAGEVLQPGSPVVRLADLGKTRVEAEVDEFDAGRVRLGDPVAVTAEGYEGRSWPGRVEEIPDAVTERQIRPQDPARPVDVRVLLVKIALGERTPLKLGQRVEVEIRPEPKIALP
jgi:RND family efflux transporter MFP subunit